MLHMQIRSGVGQRDDRPAAGLHFPPIFDLTFGNNASLKASAKVGIPVQSGRWPVLHLSGGIPLRMDVGNFLQLQSAFQREGKGMAAPQIEEAVGGRIQRGQHLCRFPHGGQGILDLLRQAVQGGERFMAGLASSSPLRCP